MRKFYLIIAALSTFAFISSCELLEDAVNEQTGNIDIAAGLKEALRVGTDTATARLGISDGYLRDQAVKILLPAEIQTQIANLKATQINLGLTTLSGEQLYNAGFESLGIKSLAAIEEDLIVGLNRAAASAASEAGPIFYDAITSITINDAENILYGSDTAATAYLVNNTYQSLFDTFEPKIDEAVSNVRVGNQSVEQLYASFVNEYNNLVNTEIPLSGVSIGSIASLNAIQNSDISTHATEKGLDGLFLKVQDEEGKIRNNIGNRVTDLLERVFGLLD